MSTNFLNRRMDLKHAYEKHFISASTFEFANILTMDTSYPVKLAGKVLKLFTASVSYPYSNHSGTMTGDDWILQNSEGEQILRISTANVYDFAGRRIDDNIGEDKAYSANASVFQQMDYVMVIIDFDDENGNVNPSIHLCSQTNFENFITDNGEGEGNLKLFEIDGSKNPTDTDENFDYKFNESIFNEAVEFENEEDKHSFTRFVNADDEEEKDSVLYQEPKNIYDEDDNLIGRKMIPVAKVNSIDVNNLTAVVNQFMFAYMDNVNMDEKGGTESVNKLMAFMTFNGSMNEDFMNNFCYSAQEVLALPIVTSATSKMKHYMLEEYYNIPEINRNEFKYVLMALTDSDDYSSAKYSKDVRFVPIRISDNSFASLFEINNRGFVVDGESVELPASWGIYGNNVGQLEENDARDFYSTMHYADGFGYRKTIYKKDNIGSVNEDNPFNSYGYHSTFVYIGDDTVSNNFLVQGKNEQESWELFSSNSELSNLCKFIDFFEDSYTDRLKDYTITPMSETAATWSKHSHYITLDDEVRSELPITVVLEYPEIYDSLIKAGEYDITNYELSNITNFDRTNVRFKNRISPKNHYDNMAIAYKLFNTKAVDGYIPNSKTGYDKSCEMYFTDSESEEPTTVKYMFNSSRNLSSSGISKDSYNYGLLITDGNQALYSPIKIVSVNNIGRKRGSTLDYNNSDISITEFTVVKPYKRAKDNIFKDDVTNNLKIYTNSEKTTAANLYVVAKATDTESGSDIYTIDGVRYIIKFANTVDNNYNFKSSGTDWKGSYVYLYYSNTDGWHRIKYYYRNNYTRDIEEDYDYYTDNVVIDNISNVWNSDKEWIENLNRINKENIYIRAYLNYLAVTNYDGDLLDCLNNKRGTTLPPNEVITYVAAVYGLAITQELDNPSYGISNIKYESSLLDFTCTYNLTIDIDDIIIYPGSSNDAGVYGYKQIRLSDMINPAKTTIHKNMMTPLLSSSNNSKVFNIKTYLEKIKTYSGRDIVRSDIYSSHSTLNINGIDNTIINLKLTEFYKRALVSDLSYNQNDSTSYFETVELLDRVFFKRSLVDSIYLAIDYNENGKGEYYYVDKDSNSISLTTQNNNGVVFHSNLNPKNLFDINKITINNSNSSDVTNSFVKDTPIWVNHNQTGTRETYSISLSNGDPFNLSLLATTGNEGTIEVDDINWSNLLVALGNNEDIDILSTPLKTIKSSFKDRFSGQMQNISDTITMSENQNTINNANAITTPFPAGEQYDKYRQPDGTPNAVYNDEYGIYEFFFGYGYQGPQFGKHRILDNRGVIVFVSSEGDSYMQQGSGGVYDEYTNRDSVIHPKRMYINNDGLLCTKEYFDNEAAEYTPVGSTAPVYPENPTTIAALLKKIEELEDRIAALES